MLHPWVGHIICCLVLFQCRKTGNRPDMTEKIVDWDVKHQNKQTNKLNCLMKLLQSLVHTLFHSAYLVTSCPISISTHKIAKIIFSAHSNILENL